MDKIGHLVQERLDNRLHKVLEFKILKEVFYNDLGTIALRA